jgi:uncharacterized surface protein with fasciclin (FAS1) repeats
MSIAAATAQSIVPSPLQQDAVVIVKTENGYSLRGRGSENPDGDADDFSVIDLEIGAGANPSQPPSSLYPGQGQSLVNANNARCRFDGQQTVCKYKFGYYSKRPTMPQSLSFVTTTQRSTLTTTGTSPFSILMYFLNQLDDRICTDGTLSEFCSAIQTAGLGPMLQSSSNTFWTIFVPTNQAIMKQQQHFRSLDTPSLQQFVLFHVCDQDYYKNELACNVQLSNRHMIRMETGHNCNILCDDQQSPEYLLGLGNVEWPKFVEFDIAACNGVIHVLDGVLLSTME